MKDPRQLIYIDESHKDRNSSRRRRAWGRKGSDGIAIKRWFKDTMRYTLIASMNIDGFIPSTLKVFPRNNISTEGAAGTVGGEEFEEWVSEHLLPVLGDYGNTEENSIFVLDNASTHLNDEIEEAVSSVGTILIYGAPYSPHLNLIKPHFGL